MAKSITIDPGKRRKKAASVFRTSPSTLIRRRLQRKRTILVSRILRILRDMVIIREFESMLNEIKTKGEYAGMVYNYPGPAHLGIGQEAA